MAKKKSNPAEDLIAGRSLVVGNPLQPPPGKSQPEPPQTSQPEPKRASTVSAGRPPAIENPVKVTAFISKEARADLSRIQLHFQSKGEPNTIGYAVDQAVKAFIKSLENG